MQFLAETAFLRCKFGGFFWGGMLFGEHSEWLDSEWGLRKLYKSCLCDYLVMIEKIP